MDSRTPPTAHAEQLLDLLPRLSLWARNAALEVSADFDLSLRQYAALRGIRDGLRSAGELARLWQVTPAVITGIIDRLERRGLVRREGDPGDRRRLRLTLTEKGVAACRAVEGALIGELAARLAAAAPAELDALGRALSMLNRALGGVEGAGPPPPGGEEQPEGGAAGPERRRRTARSSEGQRVRPQRRRVAR